MFNYSSISWLLILICALVGQVQADSSLSAELVREVKFRASGGEVVRFGDLTGDHKADMIAVQNYQQRITAVTAITLDGRRLWRIGRRIRKNYAISYDLPVQIFDIDQNGDNEVVMVWRGKLQIRRGRDGKLLKSRRLPPQACDAIYVGNFLKNGQLGIVVKNRYKRFLVFNSDLILRWSARGKTGHYPLSFDADGDGQEELLVGYRLYDADGNLVWNQEDNLLAHNDAMDVGDLGGEDGLVVAMATSRSSVLLRASDGQILWEKEHGHSQHAVIGKYDHNFPEEGQAAFIDRASNGTIYCYDKYGQPRWSSLPQGYRTVVSTISGWTGQPGQDYLLAFRRADGPPVMFDKDGKEALQFPFEPARLKNGKGFDKYFVQHFDLEGDCREEVMVYNHRQLWIYKNSSEAPELCDVNEGLPNPRIYNSSYYSGPQ